MVGLEMAGKTEMLGWILVGTAEMLGLERVGTTEMSGWEQVGTTEMLGWDRDIATEMTGCETLSAPVEAGGKCWLLFLRLKLETARYKLGLDASSCWDKNRLNSKHFYRIYS